MMDHGRQNVFTILLEEFCGQRGICKCMKNRSIILKTDVKEIGCEVVNCIELARNNIR
jgi:hypothetical protein